MRSLNGRLTALERRTAKWPGTEPLAPRTDADWLACFEQDEMRRALASEPDFPAALEAYRRAVAAAWSRADRIAGEGLPPYRGLPEWEWLAEMVFRVEKGQPPVTEAEFHALSAWFKENQGRFGDAHGVIDLGEGGSIMRHRLLDGIGKGPRVVNVTEIVEALRWLKTMDDRV